MQAFVLLYLIMQNLKKIAASKEDKNSFKKVLKVPLDT